MNICCIKKFHIGLLFVFLTVVCAVIYYVVTSTDSPIDPPTDAVVYTDESAMELFLDESLWAMPDLLQHELYLFNEEMNMDFWFAKTADDYQINNARSFVLTTFVLRQSRILVPYSYGALLLDKDVSWKTVSCKVYCGNKLLYHERYDEHNQLIKE